MYQALVAALREVQHLNRELDFIADHPEISDEEYDRVQDELALAEARVDELTHQVTPRQYADALDEIYDTLEIEELAIEEL